jgi:hypothetical protein
MSVRAAVVVVVAVLLVTTGRSGVTLTGDVDGFTVARHAADGSPVRGCAPVHLVVNPADGPPDALAAVEAAADALSEASGLPVVVDGPTEAAPSADWPQVGRPVLVAWAAPGTGQLGASGKSGAATSAWVGDRYVSGLVVLNSEHIDLMRTGYGGDRTGALLLHEVGHVLGLGHVDDPTQVMYPTVGAAITLEGGDRTGLAAVGTDACSDSPPATAR